MTDPTDLWFVRFPNGRLVRVAGTALLRQYLNAGRLPLGIQVRRSSADEWLALHRTEEFADLAEGSGERPALGSDGEPATVASRLDPTRLHLLGVRGLLQELLVSLDSLLRPDKLRACALAGLVLGALLALARFSAFEFGVWPPGWGWSLLLAGLLVGALLTALLSRLTYLELAQLRPAHWRDGLSGLVGLTLRLSLVQGAGFGSLAGLLALLHWLPAWLLRDVEGSAGAAFWQAAGHVAVAAGQVLCVAAWLAGLLLLPLPPLLVVEECSLASGVAQWLALLRRHLGRALLFEGLAVGVGLAVLAPFALPVLALLGWMPGEWLPLTARCTRDVLGGVAAGLLLGHFVVSNVFIYLNLRYASGHRR
jgi:hypothetical protein